MRFRFLLILIGVVVISLASGLGLRFALAWVEPTQSPPDGNVPGPVNIGSGAQTKAGSLTIGGVFTVVGAGSGAVIGNPTNGNMGEGSLNAVKLCINGVCQTSWPTATDVFIQNGNSFGTRAILGTNDAYGLTFETNNIERVRITAVGKVGIGTTTPEMFLHVKTSEAYPLKLERTGTGAGLFGFSPLMNGSAVDMFLEGAQASTGFVLRSRDSSNTPVNALGIDRDGNVGIGTTTPSAKLVVEGGQAIFNNSGGNEYIVINSDVASQTAVFFQRGGTTRSSLYNSAVADALVLTDGANADTMYLKSGNVGIGTTNPLYKLTVAGASPREYIWATSGNPELDLGDGINHWAIYRDTASDELRFWRNNDNVTMTAAGDINSKRCFGPVYVGRTGSTYNGARGGYASANALCAASVAGSHVCTTSEILETVKCNQASLPTADQAWISNGPPGYTARANDCTGWTSTSPSGPTTVYGAIWAFDANGGVGWVTTCNMTLKFACCK